MDASVRKRPQAFAKGRTCRRDENRRETQNCRHFLRFILQKCQQSQGSGVLVAKRRTVVTFGLASGERKGERREEKREMRGEKRGERREEKRRVDR